MVDDWDETIVHVVRLRVHDNDYVHFAKAANRWLKSSIGAHREAWSADSKTDTRIEFYETKFYFKTRGHRLRFKLWADLDGRAFKVEDYHLYADDPEFRRVSPLRYG